MFAGGLNQIRMRRHAAEATALEKLAAEWLRLLPDLLPAAANPAASPALICALFQVDLLHPAVIKIGQAAYTLTDFLACNIVG